jgi:hypothetical protein
MSSSSSGTVGERSALSAQFLKNGDNFSADVVDTLGRFMSSAKAIEQAPQITFSAEQLPYYELDGLKDQIVLTRMLQRRIQVLPDGESNYLMSVDRLINVLKTPGRARTALLDRTGASVDTLDFVRSKFESLLESGFVNSHSRVRVEDAIVTRNRGAFNLTYEFARSDPQEQEDKVVHRRIRSSEGVSVMYFPPDDKGPVFNVSMTLVVKDLANLEGWAWFESDSTGKRLSNDVINFMGFTMDDKDTTSWVAAAKVLFSSTLESRLDIGELRTRILNDAPKRLTHEATWVSEDEFTIKLRDYFAFVIRDASSKLIQIIFQRKTRYSGSDSSLKFSIMMPREPPRIREMVGESTSKLLEATRAWMYWFLVPLQRDAVAFFPAISVLALRALVKIFGRIGEAVRKEKEASESSEAGKKRFLPRVRIGNGVVPDQVPVNSSEIARYWADRFIAATENTQRQIPNEVELAFLKKEKQLGERHMGTLQVLLQDESFRSQLVGQLEGNVQWTSVVAANWLAFNLLEQFNAYKRFYPLNITFFPTGAENAIVGNIAIHEIVLSESTSELAWKLLIFGQATSFTSVIAARE